MNIYELEYLIRTFSAHSEKAEEIRKKSIESFEEYNPGEPLPDHMEDDFNLPRALASICSELLRIQHMISVIDKELQYLDKLIK